MKEGKVIKKGIPENIIDKDLIKEIYNIDALIINNELSGKPHVIYGNKEKNIDVL